MNPLRIVDAAELKVLYLEQMWTIARLAGHYGCSDTTIRRRLQALRIPIRRRGPHLDAKRTFTWTPQLAYAIGLIATDGNLSRDLRHLTLTSADEDLLLTARDCLGLRASIRRVPGRLRDYFRLQWGDRQFCEWLSQLGLMPDKSLRLGALAIPENHLADFVRGCLDGDGTIGVYRDAYHTRTNPSYIYNRLSVRFTSASRAFLEWLQGGILQKSGADGRIFTRRPPAGRSTYWDLKYAKGASLTLLNWIYYKPDVPCLDRKRAQAAPFLR